MNSNEFKRWLQKQGATFTPAKGGHIKVQLGSRVSFLPMHGNAKELGKGLVEKIKRQLGLR